MSGSRLLCISSCHHIWVGKGGVERGRHGVGKKSYELSLVTGHHERPLGVRVDGGLRNGAAKFFGQRLYARALLFGLQKSGPAGQVKPRQRSGNLFRSG